MFIGIKNIIFDLCGPIITLDLELMNRRFHEFGVTVEKPYQLLRNAGLTKLYESGRVSTEDFCDQVRQLLATQLTREQIIDAWNTLIVDFPQRHIEYIRQLHKRYRLFLLSNSDVTNAQFFKDYLNRHAGFDFVNDCFDEVFFSCELYDRKPSPAVFRHIVDKHGLIPEETLVVDDCLAHCEGAASIGLRTHWLRPDEDICDLKLE